MKKGKNDSRPSNNKLPQSQYDLAQIAKDNQLENIDNLKNTIMGTESVIDKICQKGGEILYENYLQPKIQPRAIEFHKLNMNEIIQQSQQPADFGEKDPVRGQSFNEEIWTPEEEPTFVPTYNDNFKPKVVTVKQMEPSFDNMSLAS